MEVEVGLSSANLSSHTRLDFNERNRIVIERRRTIPLRPKKSSIGRKENEEEERQKPGLTIFLGSLKQLPKLLQISIIAPSVVWVAWMIGSRYCIGHLSVHSTV
jgi:hypothetical protein